MPYTDKGGKALNYCDLHCDTPLELYLKGCGFDSDKLNVNLQGIRGFDRYVQLAAYCVPEDMDSDEGFELFFKVNEIFTAECEQNSFHICRCRDDIIASEASPAFIRTVEDARILNGNITRLDSLYSTGVRVLTPLWGGETCIGGSHQSVLGLTDFGVEVFNRCCELGVILVISHASFKSADEILDICKTHGGAVMASHSCSYSVNPHSRNITDAHAKAVADIGGVIGINTFPPHLRGTSADVSDVIRHISHLISVAGEDHVAIGADFDGMGTFTTGLEEIGQIPDLLSEMKSAGFGEDLCEKILFTNAYRFLTENL